MIDSLGLSAAYYDVCMANCPMARSRLRRLRGVVRLRAYHRRRGMSYVNHDASFVRTGKERRMNSMSHLN